MNFLLALLPTIVGAVLTGWSVYVIPWNPMYGVCGAWVAGLIVGLSGHYSVSAEAEHD